MANEKERILIVDDTPDTLHILQRNLQAVGYATLTAQDVPSAVRILDETPIDLVITDYKMPHYSGLDLVRHVRENLRDTEVMMITGYPSVGSAVGAVKAGAAEYLSKPFTEEELLAAVESVLDKLRIRRAAKAPEEVPVAARQGLIGDSSSMQAVFSQIARVSGTNATVLISGESGTGKELVARAIHYSSQRAAAPFVPVNCSAIPETLLESELFGYVKGAFTGATETRAGFFQVAEGGTIFLDEISATNAAAQVKLLRVLQEKEICMVGSARPRQVEIRIIAATNKDLGTLVQHGQFREDLFFRLNVINIALPPLRSRGNDVLLLAAHFAKMYAEELGRAVPRFSDEALHILQTYHWPGNVRELQNTIQRIVVMSDSEVIDTIDLPQHMRHSPARSVRLDRTLAEVEAEYVRQVVESVGGNRTRAAQILDIDRKTLREKLKATEPVATT